MCKLLGEHAVRSIMEVSGADRIMSHLGILQGEGPGAFSA